MTAILTIRVPGKAVSVNRMYANNPGKGRRIKTIAAQTWETLTCLKAREALHLHRMALATPLRIVCTFYGLRSNADGHNYLKATLDGLEQGLGINDKHFTDTRAVKCSDGTYTDGAVIEVWASEATK
jgi:hypothetical protein